MSGSSASLLARLAPDIVRSVQGETSQVQAGPSSLAARRRLTSAIVRFPPALSPPTPAGSAVGVSGVFGGFLRQSQRRMEASSLFIFLVFWSWALAHLNPRKPPKPAA